MTRAELSRFLAECWPLLGYEPEGFRRVGKLVQKRLRRRLRALG